MDKKENYKIVRDILSSRFEEVNGCDFYRYIFPNNENKGELNTDFSKPNAIYLYQDEKDNGSKRKLRRRIMLNDTWEEDFMEYVECNPLALCSGLSYRGRANRLEKAQRMNAMIFDLDCVGENELMTLFLRIGKEPGLRKLPQPTFIVMSGTGLHLYYVLKEPIDLFPNIKLQLKRLKYDLTFTLWDYKSTSQEKQIQYQGINQGFRMVGSMNGKYDLQVRAFRTGEKVDLETMNRYAIDKKNVVDLDKPFSPTKYTKAEAKEKFPDWYQRVIVEGNKNKKKWAVSRDVYDWWLRKVENIKGGHRYFYLMCLVIYAVKCDISKAELRKDMQIAFEKLKQIDHSNPLTEEDMNSALEAYDRAYFNFTIEDIEKLTDIRIERNKRNYQKQKYHLEEARAIRDIRMKRQGKKWTDGNGRPVGSGTKEKLVKDYIEKNPEDSPTEIARALGISRTTVYKYWEKKDKGT